MEPPKHALMETLERMDAFNPNYNKVPKAKTIYRMEDLR